MSVESIILRRHNESLSWRFTSAILMEGTKRFSHTINREQFHFGYVSTLGSMETRCKSNGQWLGLRNREAELKFHSNSLHSLRCWYLWERYESSSPPPARYGCIAGRTRFCGLGWQLVCRGGRWQPAAGKNLPRRSCGDGYMIA